MDIQIGAMVIVQGLEGTWVVSAVSETHVRLQRPGFVFYCPLENYLEFVADGVFFVLGSVN